MGTILTRTTTYIFRSIGFIFGCLRQHTREHIEVELIGIVEESDYEEGERKVGLQETYNSLLEKTGEYAKVAKATIRKMKKAE